LPGVVNVVREWFFLGNCW